MSEEVREMTEVEKLINENKELRYELNDALRRGDKWVFEKELAFKDGVIYGLKYAMRCNGVSGGEVKDETD